MTNTTNPLEMPAIERPDWPRHAANEYPILACVQFDATGESALAHALRLVQAQGAGPLHVAHVIADTSTSGRGAVITRHEHELEAAGQTLQAFVAERVGDVPVRLHVRIGEPVETILQLALEYDVELVVVGTHGRTGVRRLALGSISSRLVESARMPVLLACARDFSGMEKTLIPDPPRPL